jgi:hypothetical protein
MRNVYFKGPMQSHCYYLAKAYQQAADQDKALAAAQRKMARRPVAQLDNEIKGQGANVLPT